MRHGFTLVELSIVLVIIGLLIGGLLAAQSMISTAKIQAQIRQIQQIEIAVRNFKTKYNSLPGDSAAFNSPGNSNGKIDASDFGNGGTWNFMEYKKVFNHLIQSGFYGMNAYDDSSGAADTPGVLFPAMILSSNTPQSSAKIGGVVVGSEDAFLYIKEGVKIHLGACPGTGGNPYLTFQCGITPTEAFAIDAKVDDGKPFSGNAVITGNGYVDFVPGGTYDHTNNCGDSVANSYNVSTKNGCALEFYEEF